MYGHDSSNKKNWLVSNSTWSRKNVLASTNYLKALFDMYECLPEFCYYCRKIMNVSIVLNLTDTRYKINNLKLHHFNLKQYSNLELRISKPHGIISRKIDCLNALSHSSNSRNFRLCPNLFRLRRGIHAATTSKI